MATTWTEEQTQAIELHDRNLLVSAAAGSGKTAVLVERIIRMITSDHPIDADRLLVLTFTRAAALEMKERVLARLESLLKDNPGNPLLERQAALMGHASITTIDSFCLRVVRDYFNEIELDPDFRIGEEGELALLRADCMEKLLEDCYEEGNPDFLNLAEAYGGEKSDHNLEDYILSIFRFAQSCPFPEDWIRDAIKSFSYDDPEDIEKAPFMEFLKGHYEKLFKELKEEACRLLAITRQADGPDFYEGMMHSDIALIDGFLNAKTFTDYCRLSNTIKFDRKPTKKKFNCDERLKDEVSAGRDLLKKQVETVSKKLKELDPDEITEVMKGIKKPMTVLLNLTLEFSELYSRTKTEKNILEFADIEHLALQILYDKEAGERTPAARELQEQFAEILVDEYQDSNYLQETILNSISKEADGHPNMFMVGDVKQSIYRFRMARPEIFMDKYKKYLPDFDESFPYQKICLTRNFRSRSQVLEGINRIFYRIMTENLGDIEYDDLAALHPGTEYAPLSKEESEEYGSHYLTDEDHPALKLVMIDMDKDETAALSKSDLLEEEVKNANAEAHAIAREIRRITDKKEGQLVFDKKLGGYRPANYRDIVILMRSVKDADTYLDILSAEGIPATANASGYFSALEVRIMLSLLQIIDNPMQDIPLAAVLKSPFGGFSAVDLARICAIYQKKQEEKDPSLFAACKYFVSQSFQGADQKAAADYENNSGQSDIEDMEAMEEIRVRLGEFLARLEGYRNMADFTGAGDLLNYLYQDTGYYDYVSAMPSGTVRRMNLDMLAQKARDYETTSYRGLFHFVRYMQHLEEYEIDFDQGSEFGEQDNIVRICSIHKSKGLEYPIVMIAGFAKLFNQQDSRSAVVLHPDLGIAAHFVDLENRCKVASAASVAIKTRLELDTLGEELRILYVAMTRARESLIMIAADKSLKKRLEAYSNEEWTDHPVPYRLISTARTYLDWVLMAAGNQLYDFFEVEILSAGQVFADPALRLIEDQEVLEKLKLKAEHAPVKGYDEAAFKLLERSGHDQYAFLEAVTIQSKFSVSELKHEAAARLEELKEDQELLLPGLSEQSEGENASGKMKNAFAADTVHEKGAARGTAFHRVMELLDPGTAYHTDRIRQEIDKFVEQKLMTREQGDCVDLWKVYSFYQSDLGKRFAKAFKEGKLFRERSFIMAMKAHDVLEKWTSDEDVLIQGIIDAYFEEDGEIVLLDYKSDRGVKEQDLKDRYFRQFELYRYAIESITGMKVKESYLWSFSLNSPIAMMG